MVHVVGVGGGYCRRGMVVEVGCGLVLGDSTYYDGDNLDFESSLPVASHYGLF